MADQATSVLSQDAIDSLFTSVPSADPVVTPGTSLDGVTRTATVGDAPEVPAPPLAAPAARPWSNPAEAQQPAPVAQAAPPAVAPPAPPPAGATPEAQTALAVVQQRLAQIEASLARLGQLEAKVASLEARAGGEVSKRDLQAVQGALVKQIKSIVGNLQSTPAYGLRKTFVCSGCGEHGNVAVRVRCTSCNRETFVGWHPQDRREAARRSAQQGAPARQERRAGPPRRQAGARPNGGTSPRARPAPARGPR